MRRGLVGVSACVAACLPLAADDAPADPVVGAPRITDVALTCDLEAGRWRVDVDTDAWAGGATLLWALDDTYVERHTAFRSIEAAADGTADRLRLDVGIVTDFRAAGDGSTLFLCTAEPAALVWVADVDGTVTDCVGVGEDLDRVLRVERRPDRCGPVPEPPDTDTDPAETDDPGDTDGR